MDVILEPVSKYSKYKNFDSVIQRLEEIRMSISNQIVGMDEPIDL